ncbi:MAG TPA: hypothetical protein VEC96_13895 [Anaerolineae bacterium]|nr:hypothetical protein [Anaerolineae bacterium]
MNLDLLHDCGGKFQHVDEQDNNNGTVTDSYQCDGCQVWRSITWDKRTERVLQVEEEQDNPDSETCDVCGFKNAALCSDGLYRCFKCIERIVSRQETRQ